jgi:MOSC domain-containing protein YiiM
MEVISLNVGLPREINWKNKRVITAIFKSPVSGKQQVSFLNIAGDKQADLTVHGGGDKAIYAYASEHYDYWRRLYPDKQMDWGMFGENLTVKGGLFEDQINIGDCFRLGTAELMAVQPRMPCFKLGIRFGTELVIRQFMKSGFSGVYFRVTREGEAEAGNNLEKIRASGNKVSITDINKILAGETDIAVLEKAANHPDLAESLQGYFREKLEKLSG